MPSRAPDTETRRHSVACHEGDQKQRDSDTGCGYFFCILVLEYNVRRSMQCSAILGVLVEDQVVECELSESSGTKTPSSSVFWSTASAMFVIHL